MAMVKCKCKGVMGECDARLDAKVEELRRGAISTGFEESIGEEFDSESDDSVNTEEASNMLQTEKTPKRSSAVIRKALAEKAAAEASRILQLESDMEAAKQRANDAETARKQAEEAQKKPAESAKKADEALKKAQTDLGNLQGVFEENTNLKTKVQKLEKEVAQAQINFAATLEAEQNRLVAESDADNDARTRIMASGHWLTKEALNMLQTKKTPKRPSAVIRKALAEKAAAEVKSKGGEVGKSFEIQLKRAREETPAAMLRVDGLKRPYSHKREEVKWAKKSAIDADNISLHLTIVNELETKAINMTQASRIQQLESDLEAAMQRATDAEMARKEAEEAKKKAAESANKADEALKKPQTDLGNL
ncbi:plectin-like [Chenopodium quinoa]|uniref:plectin-like n=1 Tax=Chenopodium quinoa TaxID=63459 RepID=UPI000B7876A2|nr:plectin-like [Chenopodium quinoa]